MTTQAAELYVTKNTSVSAIFGAKIKGRIIRKWITPAFAAQITANYFEITVASMQSKTRERRIAMARFICYKVLRKHSRESLKKISGYFNRDHTTVIHGLETLNDLIPLYPEIKRDFEAIESLVLSNE